MFARVRQHSLNQKFGELIRFDSNNSINLSKINGLMEEEEEGENVFEQPNFIEDVREEYSLYIQDENYKTKAEMSHEEDEKLSNVPVGVHANFNSRSTLQFEKVIRYDLDDIRE